MSDMADEWPDDTINRLTKENGRLSNLLEMANLTVKKDVSAIDLLTEERDGLKARVERMEKALSRVLDEEFCIACRYGYSEFTHICIRRIVKSALEGEGKADELR